MRRNLVLSCLLLALVLIAEAGAQQSVRLHRYVVEVDSALATLRVKACFAGPVPRYLMAESLDAAGALRNARMEGAPRALEPNGAQLALKSAASDACLGYEVDIAQPGARHERGGNLAGRVGDDLLLDMGLWFWRPESLAADEDIEVEFALPEGVRVSVPWRAADAGAASDPARPRFRTGPSPYDWPALIAFGRFREQTLPVPGADLRLVVLGVTPRIPVERISQWMHNAALGVTRAYGRFPVSGARILVVPNAQGNDPVPWAFVQRGGGLSVQFFINHRLPDAVFLSEWSLYHEMAHLLLPYVVSQDAWLSEGMASYYENVLRARHGVITELDAWRRLHAGYARGRRSQVGTTLADATERMYRNAGFMRVYWQGAALLTLADLRVRARTGGRHSLDTALEGIALCCLNDAAPWRARDLLARMDAITGTTVFTELHDQQIRAAEFPDLREVYDAYGLTLTEGELRLDDDASRQALREALMRAPAGSAPARAAQ